MKTAVVVAFALALPSCALLQDTKETKKEWDERSPTGTVEYGHPGRYFAAGLLGSMEAFDVPADDSDVGVAFRGGVRLDERVAIEGTFEDAAGFRAGRGPVSTDLDIWSLGVQGKYYFTPGKIQPYGLVGLGVARVDVDRFGGDDDGGYFRLGMGSDFWLNPDVAVFAEGHFNRTLGGIKGFDHLDFLVGLQVRF